LSIQAYTPTHIKAIDCGKAAYGPTHRYVLQDMIELGATLYRVGRYESALNKYLEVLPHKEKQCGGRNHLDISRLLSRIGRCYKHMRNKDAAKDYFTQAMTVDQELFGKEHPEVAADLVRVCTHHRRKYSD
jgi:tetratricopeptide (TPR) repeat protein